MVYTFRNDNWDLGSSTYGELNTLEHHRKMDMGSIEQLEYAYLTILNSQYAIMKVKHN